jgi:molybdate transport system ATP-binding protein
MDEPLSSLDEKRKEEVIPFLERLRDQARVPIVYVSHVFSEIDRLSGKVVRMSDGQVLDPSSEPSRSSRPSPTRV